MLSGDPKAQTQLPFKLQGGKTMAVSEETISATINGSVAVVCTIYNESAEAENHKLANVAGSGYRKGA